MTVSKSPPWVFACFSQWINQRTGIMALFGAVGNNDVKALAHSAATRSVKIRVESEGIMTEVTPTQDNFFRGYSGDRFQRYTGFGNEAGLTQAKGRPEPASNVDKPPRQATMLAQISAQRYSLQARIEQRQSLELELVTQDGDTISLQLDVSRSAEFRRSYEQISAGAFNGRAGIAGLQSQLAQQLEFSSLGDLSIVVNGELDEGELQALKALFDDLDALASRFFSGSTEAARSLALDFELDSSEFASLELDLNRQQRFSAVETYQNVQTISSQSQRGSFARGPTVLEVLDQAEQRIEALNEQDLTITQESRVDLLSLFLSSLEKFLDTSLEVEETDEAGAGEIQESADSESDSFEEVENEDD